MVKTVDRKIMDKITCEKKENQTNITLYVFDFTKYENTTFK